MADKDLQINIRTIADTTGIILTQEQLNALQTAAAAGNKEAIDAIKKLSAAQKEAAATARAAQQEFVSGIRAAAGYGLLLGGVVAKAINDVAASQEKITKELDKQFESLGKNVQQWNKLAQSATAASDLASIGEKAITQIDEIHAKWKETNAEQRTLWQSTINEVTHMFMQGATFGMTQYKGVLEEQRQALLTGLSDAEEIARKQAGAAIERGREEQAAFERLKSSGLDEAVKKTTDHLKEAKLVLDSLNPRENLESWIAQERIVERITKELQLLQKAQQEAAKAGQPTTTQGVLQKQLAALSNLPPTLTPLEEKQARDAYIATQNALRDQQISDQKKRRDDEAQALRDRYEKGFPEAKTPLPGGPTQIESNKELITWMQKLYQLWQ